MQVDDFDFSSKLKNLMEDEVDLGLLHQYVVKIFSTDNFEKFSPSFLASVALIISRITEKLNIASFSDTNFSVDGDDADSEDVDVNIPQAAKLAISSLLGNALWIHFMKNIK